MDKITSDKILLQKQAARFMDEQEFLHVDLPSREEVIQAVAARHSIGPKTLQNMSQFELDYMFINLELPQVVGLV